MEEQDTETMDEESTDDPYYDPDEQAYETGWCGHDFDLYVQECMDASINDDIQWYQCLQTGEMGSNSRLALYEALVDRTTSDAAQADKDDGCENPYIDGFIEFAAEWERALKLADAGENTPQLHPGNRFGFLCFSRYAHRENSFQTRFLLIKSSNSL